MGLLYVEAAVRAGGRKEKVNPHVDSGATCTVLRRNIW